MPKISAATVAEHREVQTRALLDAARNIFAETGNRPTLADVAARAGLARSSVYQYFKSADDLLMAVVDDIFPRWQTLIEEEMSGAKTPGERIVTYVYANLKLVDNGEHAIATALHKAEPAHANSERAMRMHHLIGLPLLEALEDAGVENVEVSSSLITGVLSTAANLLEKGTAFDEVWRSTRSFLEGFDR